MALFGPGMMGAYGTGFFGVWFMVMFWVLVLIGLAVLVRWVGWGHHHEKHRHVLDILRERYARGEIDTEEFHRRRKELR